MSEERSPTIGEMKESIKEINERLAEAREQRIAVGLPAEIPDRFVNPIHAEALKLRLDPLQEVLTDYLELTNKARRIIPIDPTSFDSYTRDVTLLRWSPIFLQSVYGMMLSRCIETVKEAQGGEVAYERVVSQLLKGLSLAQSFKTFEYKSDDPNDYYPKIITPYDGDDFDDILDDYWTHYTSEILPRKEKEYELLGWTFAG